MDKKRLVEIHLGELIDRALRFYQHLEHIDDEFYKSPMASSSNDLSNKMAFLDSYRQCILSVMRIANVLGTTSREMEIDVQCDTIIGCVNQSL